MQYYYSNELPSNRLANILKDNAAIRKFLSGIYTKENKKNS